MFVIAEARGGKGLEWKLWPRSDWNWQESECGGTQGADEELQGSAADAPLAGAVGKSTAQAAAACGFSARWVLKLAGRLNKQGASAISSHQT